MQSGYLVITVGFQFFLLVGYLFYFMFRKWSEVEDQVMLMTWVARFVAILTLGLLTIVVIILPRLVLGEAIFIALLMIVDSIGLILLAKETWNRKMTIEHGFIDDET
ncbi:MAG: hypothetical protein ACFFF9_12120 [Candidatus Thorarchaeota archaeon]